MVANETDHQQARCYLLPPSPHSLPHAAVPGEYFSYLDHTGRRTDAMQRPELCMGSVEYTATKEYCKVSPWGR